MNKPKEYKIPPMPRGFAYAQKFLDKEKKRHRKRGIYNPDWWYDANPHWSDKETEKINAKNPH